MNAVPTPITDAESDLWFVHRYMMTSNVFTTAVGFEAVNGRLFEIDSKAMRKVNDNEDVIVVAELSGEGSGFNLTVAGRVLIKES